MSEQHFIPELFRPFIWSPRFSKLQEIPFFLIALLGLKLFLPPIQCAPCNLSLWDGRAYRVYDRSPHS